MSFKRFQFYCFILLVCWRKTFASILAVDGNNETESFFDSEVYFNDNIQGVIVEANPVDGCTNITGPPRQPSNHSVNWFVLISGGFCSTHIKIAHAIEAKYAAAIIYASYRDEGFVIPRYFHQFSSFTPNITVVLVSSVAGFRIREKYLYNIDPGAYIIILPNAGFSILKFLFLFAIVSGTVILIMLVFMIIRCIQQNRRQRRNRLSTRHLKHLTTIKYRRGDPYDMCAICLEDYKEKEKLRILPCSHGYHCKCIDPWLTNNRRTCPVCKQKVNLPGIHSEDADSSSSDTESRAETTPLIRNTARRNFYHGTFGNRPNAPTSGQQALSQSPRDNSGEATSRDVPSDALDDSSEDELVTVRSVSSAPDMLTTQSSKEVCSGPSQNVHKELARAGKSGTSSESNNTAQSSSSSQPKPKQEKCIKPYVV